MCRGVEYQLAGIVCEIVIPEVAEFKAELQGMCSADVIQSVSNYCRKVSASLGEVTFGAEQEPRFVLNRDHRYERHIRAHNSCQSNSSRVGWIVRREGNVDTFRAEMKFVDQVRAENVSLAQGES